MLDVEYVDEEIVADIIGFVLGNSTELENFIKLQRGPAMIIRDSFQRLSYEG